MFYVGFAAFVVFCVVAGIAMCVLSKSGRPEAGVADEPELWVWDDLAELPEILLRSGLHHGFAIFSHHASGHFLQIRKYIHGPDEYGLELGFPCVEWSRDFLPRLKDFCRENEMPFRIVREPNNPEVVRDPRPTDFLYVDFGKDAALAYSFTGRAMERLFGAGPGDGYRYEMREIDPKGRMVTDMETDRQFRRTTAAFAGPRPLDHAVYSTAGILGVTLVICGVFGLIYGFLLRGLTEVGPLRIDWAVLPFDFFGIPLRPRLFDLLCFAAIAAAFLLGTLSGRQTRNRLKRLPPWAPGKGVQPADGPPKRMPHPQAPHHRKIRKLKIIFRTTIAILVAGTVISWVS